MSSSLEFNKIAGAVLMTGLVALGVSDLSKVLVHSEAPEKVAYPLPEGSGGDEGAAAAAGDKAAEGPSLGALLAQGSAEKGLKVFKKCVACHTYDDGGKTKQGPNLFSILDRKVAGVEGFKYSKGMAALGGNWTYEQLDAFLKKPKALISDTKMSFGGIKKPQQRADLILFLRAQGSADTALPAAE